MVSSAKVLFFPDIRKCFMLFAQFIEEENAKPNFSERFNPHTVDYYTDILWFQIFLGIFVWMSRATPDPFKKSLPKSNELLRMLVRILVLDYCSLLIATIRSIRLIRVRKLSYRYRHRYRHRYLTCPRITSGEVPISVMADILCPPLAFSE